MDEKPFSCSCPLPVPLEGLATGYRDVDGFVKGRIVRRERVSVTVLIGKSAIIDSDIRHAMGEATGFFDLRFERIGLNSEKEIMQALEKYNDVGGTDLLVLSRGGGENMSVFDSGEIAEYCLELEPLFVTAIGHKEDTSLVQRVADKAFITPTALGQWMRTIYNDTMEEVEHSKANMVEVISRQVRAGYEKEMEGLKMQLRVMEMRVRDGVAGKWVGWIVMVLLGLLVGWLMGRK